MLDFEFPALESVESKVDPDFERMWDSIVLGSGSLFDPFADSLSRTSSYESQASEQADLFSFLESDDVMPETRQDKKEEVVVEGLDLLDVDQFFEENKQIPVESAQKTELSGSVPLDFSTDKIRLGQDEDKAKSNETKNHATEKNPAFTPAFKAASQREKHQIAWAPLAPRQAKEKARDKITACIKPKK